MAPALLDLQPEDAPIAGVDEELATSEAQILALVKRGDLRALKLGGRGQWRIERVAVEEFIQQVYEDTARGLSSRQDTAPADT